MLPRTIGEYASNTVRVELLRRAVALRPESGDLLFDLADALAAIGEVAAAAETYCRARRLKAPSRLPPLLLARALVASGIIATDIIAGLAIGEASAGNSDATRRLLDYDRFFSCRHLDVPAGFDRDTFHAALVSEIKGDLTYYEEPAAHATRQSWRNDRILASREAAWTALIRQVSTEIQEYVEALPIDATHPFLASRPKEIYLAGWGLISRASSYLESHYHHEAWVSAVYYVATPPETLAQGTTNGWLYVGPPTSFGPLVGWDKRLVAPRPGTLVLMPAYFFHNTQPTGLDGERICVVFDVRPSAD